MLSIAEPPSDSIQSLYSCALTAEAMGLIHKKFIGAVEDEWTLYSDKASDYTIGELIGHGASSVVYAATYHPPATDSYNPAPIPCALKVLDLDSLPRQSLQLLQRETTLMSLSKHPNVLRVRGSWINGHKLYIALRLMNKGSAADVMHYGWPGGMEEEVVRCILRQALQGLNYLHVNGFIHRDIKAANLLIDDDGTVLLGDLGVSADLSEDSSYHMTGATNPGKAFATSVTASLHQATKSRSVAFQSRPKIGKRKSFVGTPCWMAPEVIAGRQYDSAADIWSFGITALELSQGRPPRSREPSKDVLLRIINDTPPTLDREGGAHRYSRAFKDMIDSCLVKDPSKRPSAKRLLETPFFRGAKKKSYLINTILNDLPPLTQRQERRASRRHSSITTVDSWDFASTVHSPTSTIHHRRRDLTKLTPEREEPVGVFCFDDHGKRDPPKEADYPSASSSTSEGNTSTDAATEDLSTPPTNTSLMSETPPSPQSVKSSPVIRPSSAPQSEESVKKGFWSRFVSGVRRPSFSGLNYPVIADTTYPGDPGRLSPSLHWKNVGVEQNDVLGPSSNRNWVKRPSKELAGSPKIVEDVVRRPSSSHGGTSAIRAKLSSPNGRSKGTDSSIIKASMRGNILGGFIGEAKSKLSKP